MELYYNPEQMRESEIKDTFVARQWMIDELSAIVGKQPKGAGVQHVLLIGPRGMGKTTMLLMLRFAILESELAKKWMPVRFPEESYSVTDLADFWISTIAHLSYATNDPQLLSSVDGLKKDSRHATELADLAVATLKNWSRKNGKRIAILVDNFDQMLDQIRDENENARLRDVLMNDGTFMLVGGATSFFKEARGYEQPLYNFFKTYDLTALSSDQVDELLLRRAEADRNAGFKEQMRRNAGRIRVLRYFTGGSPRLVLMLYRIVASSEPFDVKRGLEKLLDEVTPYYKAKIESLPPQQRKILDNLARVSGKTHEGLTPTQLAEETRLPVNQVSSQLKRLSELGYVAAANVRSKNSYYSLAEPLYAIWHQMRFGRGNRQRLDWLVEFLKGWYSDGEGLAQCVKLAEAFKGLMGDASRVGDALDLRQCLTDALPLEYRGGAIDRLVGDCLDVGDVARVKEMLSDSDLVALTAETRQRLVDQGVVDGNRIAAAIKLRGRNFAALIEALESRDMSRAFSALDGLKPYFHLFPGLRYARAHTLRAVGRGREALRDFDEYLARAQNEVAERERAVLLCDLHEYELALEAAGRVLKKDPKSSEAHRIQVLCHLAEGRFEIANVSLQRASEIVGPDDFQEALLLALAELEAYPQLRPAIRLGILLGLDDHENAKRVWLDIAGQLGDGEIAFAISTSIRNSLAPNNLSLFQSLIRSTPAEEILLPLARAIDYLSSRDRNIIEKLSAEVRPIVQEIVDEYEKKYPSEAQPLPRRRTRKSGT